MGRASRSKQARRAGAAGTAAAGTAAAGTAAAGTAAGSGWSGDGLDGGAGEWWSAAVSARRCVRLLEAVGSAHPCLVSVMVTAIHQYLDDADQLDPDGVPGAALASVGTGLM